MKLVSVNIEAHYHLDRILPFIERECPDVLCMMEVLFTDLPKFHALGYEAVTLPITILKEPPLVGLYGCALLTRRDRVAIEKSASYYYHHESPTVVVRDKSNKDETTNTGVLVTRVACDGTTYTIGTTHFTWAPHGEIPSEVQRSDLARMRSFMNTQEPHIFCGDFNIPRHRNPLYADLVKGYTNAIPEHYASSMDKDLHRAKDIPEAQIIFTDYMVDHLLVQPPYQASNVRLEFGVSDHAAIVATISRS